MQGTARALAGSAAALFAALVLYASLYPFAGWRWPPGLQAVDLLALPWPPVKIPFDVAANLAGYLPLGLLVALASGGPGRWPRALALGLLLPALLSYAAEVTQQFLPGRHPSLLDWTLNAAGAALGALLALLLQAWTWPERLGRGLRGWIEPDAGALTLLALWPLGLLFPAPVALGMGQVWPVLQPVLAGWLDGVSWAAPWAQAVAAAAVVPRPLPALLAMLITMFGLLAPCVVAFALVRPGWRRVGLALGAAAIAVALQSLASALNYGPEHGLAWLAPGTVPALAAGVAAALLLAWLPARLVAAIGLVVITAGVALVAQAPTDPYFAQSLYAWEQGRFIRFHGLAQWVGWLWPYGALTWLLLRLGARA
jgi:VanZ family protein